MVTKKERRRMLAREHFQRQQVRRAARERRRRILNIVIATLFVLALLAALGWLLKAKVLDDDSDGSTDAPDAVTSIQRGVAAR